MRSRAWVKGGCSAGGAFCSDFQATWGPHLTRLSAAGTLRAGLQVKRSQNASGGLPALFKPHLQSVSTSLHHMQLFNCKGSIFRCTSELAKKFTV